MFQNCEVWVFVVFLHNILFVFLVDQDGMHGFSLNIDGSEFWFEPNKHLSYQEAALYCSRNGSDLAAVTSFTALKGILNRIANVIIAFSMKLLSFP